MAIPWHEPTWNQFQDKDAMTQAILANAPEDGIYLLHDEPGAQTNGQQPSGPIVFAVIQRQGDMSMAQPMIISLLIARYRHRLVPGRVGDCQIRSTQGLHLIDKLMREHSQKVLAHQVHLKDNLK
jgi:hypothetical protein